MIGRAYLAAGALAVAFGTGWAVNGWRLNAAHDAKALRDAETAHAALTLAETERDALAAELRASADIHADKLQEAQDETNTLRDRVSAGPVRLYVRANCPAAVPMLQASAAASGVDPGDRAELDPAARSAYFALRDGIDRAGAQLAACQSELSRRAR